ncbi:hypothetical protein [Lysobacter gummosus]
MSSAELRRPGRDSNGRSSLAFLRERGEKRAGSKPAPLAAG